MTWLDTNVLVALASSTHPKHAQAVNALEQKLEEGEEIALSLLIAAEFLHVITDSKRITPPLQMRDAIEWLERWTTRVQPKWLGPTSETKAVWLGWMKQFQLGRKRILDTQYAALLHTNGTKAILTDNPDDFRVFEVFTILTY